MQKSSDNYDLEQMKSPNQIKNRVCNY